MRRRSCFAHGSAAEHVAGLYARRSPKIRSRDVGSLNRMQVLIVEDHENSREELKRCLTQHGHDVTAAGDLRSAVQSLGKRQFDAVISDIALPDGTGYALISQVHRRGLDPLCIAVSGYPFPPDVREPGATGFHYHVQKPLDWEHICSLLKWTSRLVRQKDP
jgi:CheY-like chemotaxis protein